ncbi:hypothetical protein HOC35_05160 [Candidatus Woesearchaeota archaeon]|nr:hypothetical protein [Candidatus Woesearchaeota archaeon]
MVTKTITIKEKAYDMLAKDKRGDESFSDEIIRWAQTKKRPDLNQFVGMWSDMSEENYNKINSIIDKGWDPSFNKSLKELGYKK